ncbi:2-polyprenyl-3-methyl-5-hydroxy-6-metoxy-1,4-benzoquinol methylase [Halospina denitrificans]|uniref:2-polyprenyl-3-methyl-5-hydroxy-6-metoxy-1, 4-benzoquinol methylase n=1 Tax=Halospina denitrificans TaxID=332522 RepID=A0A4V3EQL4_9GAMM|nr:methyltransferase domain-containing protein [Halospina denitrificans]TDT41738.1 2-polyprenyl-3-methyl-5-hydroxy-6-metoxy-1,4-benzoquinol methylase [Halospina denitrificans]
MKLLKERSTDPELMDDDDTSNADYNQCLADLTSVNRITRTHQPTLRWLDQAIRTLPANTPITILDVACGQGDLLRMIHRFATQRNLRVTLQGLDLNPNSAIAARQATPSSMAITYYTGDVFTFTPEPPPDFIVSSQFTHHLSDSQVVSFLQWMEHHARHGWFIADLQRHPLAYYGYSLLARLARWHPIVRHDGAVSVARSFRRADWQALLAQAGIPADIRWHMPFRLCVGRLK